MRDVGIDKEYSQRVVRSLMAAHARGTSDNEEAAAFIAAQPPSATIDGADTARLDWLTEMFDYVEVWRFSKDGQKTHEHWLNRFFNPNIKFPTLREAIDAAIQQEARTGGSDE